MSHISLKNWHISPRHILYCIIILFIGYFTFVSFSRHDNFYSRRLDLGNMDQTVWNVAHGYGFTLTDPMGVSQESRLAVHADFLLILMAPLYLIWSNPKMLLVVQTVVTALGALPVYWIALDRLKSKKLALLFAGAYLLYPSLERKMLHDFHAEVLSITLLLFAYWYMYKEKYTRFLLFVVLAALGKEHVWLVAGLMGLYIVFLKKKRLFGAMVAVLAFLIFYILFWKAIPAVTPTKQHFAFIYLSEFGDRQNDILKNILTKPMTDLRLIMSPDRLYYYFQLLVPLGFLPLLSPLYLIFAGPTLLINVLSNDPLMRQIDYQYDSVIMPFLFVAAIEGYRTAEYYIGRFHIKKFKARPLMVVFVLLFTVAFSYAWGELPLEKDSRFNYFTTPQSETKLMKQVANNIPSGYTVSVTNNIGAHFSERRFLYNYPIDAEVADYSIVFLGDPYAWPSGDAQLSTLNNLLNNKQYQLFAQQGDFYAFKRMSL